MHNNMKGGRKGSNQPCSPTPPEGGCALLSSRGGPSHLTLDFGPTPYRDLSTPEFGSNRPLHIDLEGYMAVRSLRIVGAQYIEFGPGRPPLIVLKGAWAADRGINCSVSVSPAWVTSIIPLGFGGTGEGATAPSNHY
jgi:hypothetical protein